MDEITTPKPDIAGWNPTTLAVPDTEVVIFGKAMEAYKRKHHKPFPKWSEVLEVIHELGYRKVQSPN